MEIRSNGKYLGGYQGVSNGICQTEWTDQIASMYYNKDSLVTFIWFMGLKITKPTCPVERQYPYTPLALGGKLF